ncbi:MULTISPECIES: hypothetical protein [Enterococcus]|uniref:hypothetical protein n=1 Tax=Enterococcus TaxID=1350 RepID=UPI00287FF124|nr:hypothetical protein [Enterococcus faecium]
MRKSGFLCGIETIVYYRTLGKFTTLYVEAEKDSSQQNTVYSFYKMQCFPNGKTAFKVYCDHAPLVVVIKRVEAFALYLEQNKEQVGRWFT